MRHHHHRDPDARCGPPRRGSGLRWYLKARLHRRLFVGYAVSILVTGFVVASVTSALRQGPSWREEVQRVETFAAGRFAAVWDSALQREELARALAHDLDVDVTLSDDQGVALATLTPSGPRTTQACERPSMSFAVHAGGRAEGRTLGAVRVCTERHRDPRGGRQSLVALAAAILVLWALAGVMARRITRPFSELVRVVQDIGAGRLASRMQLGRHDAGELGAIAHAVNDMAERIERQIEDQRNLLAAVSHEIRSPLARLRFMVETLRDGEPAREKSLDEIDREMVSIDALVGDLLATSRMDFDAIRKVALDPLDVAARALDRAGLDASLRVLEGPPREFDGDATLVHTALTNLLANACKHGGSVRALRVSSGPKGVSFAVDDDGDGFSPEDLARAFEPFYRGDGARREGRPGVGLGLALVRRIAEVHGGRVWAENLPGGGARVGVEFAAR